MSELGKGRSLLREGLLVGLVGATVVAVWFLLLDVVRGTPLQTPGALGSALFLGAREAGAIQVTAWTVGLYTVVHGAAFALVGLVAAGLLRSADRTPSTVAFLVLATAVLEVLFVGGVAIAAEFLLGFMAWWTVLGGNLLASLAMGVLLLHWHPLTADRLRHAGEALPQA
ncbi:MAG: hypothetical protein RQ751_05015 [Longimicrobiales bacterium]|nr:hypothetical protein [Longimicrobiales bacterium]